MKESSPVNISSYAHAVGLETAQTDGWSQDARERRSLEK